MAHLLTAVRLLLAIPVSWSLANPGSLPGLVLLGLILLAIATDVLDGKVARATGNASANGMLFDHGTDFLFVTSGLAGAAYAGFLSPILPVLIVIAFTQYVVDSYFLFRLKQLRMSFLGRWNGIFYFIPLLLLALVEIDELTILSETLILCVNWIGYALMATTTASIIDRALAPLRREKSHD